LGLEYDRRIFGSDDAMPHRKINLNFLPCLPVQKNFYNTGQEDEQCIADMKTKSGIAKKKKELLDYVGKSADFVILFN